MSVSEILSSNTAHTLVYSSTATMDVTTTGDDYPNAVTERADFYPVFHSDTRRLKTLREVKVDWLNTVTSSRATLNVAVSINNGSSFSETKMISIPTGGAYQQSTATFDTEGRFFMVRISSDSGSFYRIGKVYVMAESYGRESN